MDEQKEFWFFLDRLVAEHQLVLDRPRGSRHPVFPSLVYPVDYGYLEDTTAIDGGGVDVWLGTVNERPLDAVALTVDLQKCDVELKLMLGCTEEDKQVIMDFLNGYDMRALLVRREDNLSLLRGRHSVRRFRSRAVPEELLRKVLEAAAWAPSAHNCQPWRFLVLQTLGSRHQMVAAMEDEYQRDLLAGGCTTEEVRMQMDRSRQRIVEAPVAILLCMDRSSGDEYPDERRQLAEYLMGVQGVALAGGHLLLAAHALGLGGVWMCAPLFASRAVRQALALPVEWEPQGMVLLGYPEKPSSGQPRQALDKVARFV